MFLGITLNAACTRLAPLSHSWERGWGRGLKIAAKPPTSPIRTRPALPPKGPGDYSRSTISYVNSFTFVGGALAATASAQSSPLKRLLQRARHRTQRKKTAAQSGYRSRTRRKRQCPRTDYNLTCTPWGMPAQSDKSQPQRPFSFVTCLQRNVNGR